MAALLGVTPATASAMLERLVRAGRRRTEGLRVLEAALAVPAADPGSAASNASSISNARRPP